MVESTEQLLEAVSQELDVPKADLLRDGLRVILERRLREIRTEVFDITGRYGVASAEEMEQRYREGTVREEDSWRDWQRLDQLEYRRERLLTLLRSL